MKAGTLIKLADGRMGRVTYNGLDGVGIVFGTDPVDVETIMRGSGGIIRGEESDEELQKWAPQAMLRKPYRSAVAAGLECVGDDWEAIEE